MYLSRLVINPRNPKARRDLGDVHQMHRTIMSAFPQVEEPEEARAHLAVLYRLDTDQRSGRTTLLVQSGEEPPDWNGLPPGYLFDLGGEWVNPATKSMSDALAALREGQVLRFRVRANPTKKIDTKSGPGGQRRNGRRVDLRTEAQQIEWLSRRSGPSGFRFVLVGPDSNVPAVQVGAIEKLHGRQEVGRVTLAGVLFEGLLEVTNPDNLRLAIREGIGPGKAFGCGLLSLAPHRSAHETQGLARSTQGQR